MIEYCKPPSGVRHTWSDNGYGRTHWYFDKDRKEWVKYLFLNWDEVKKQKAIDNSKFCATL